MALVPCSVEEITVITVYMQVTLQQTGDSCPFELSKDVQPVLMMAVLAGEAAVEVEHSRWDAV